MTCWWGSSCCSGWAPSPTCRCPSAAHRSAAAAASRLIADFDEIGGLKPRAPVVISGVKVGQVAPIDLGTGLPGPRHARPPAGARAPHRHDGVDRHRRAARRPLHLAPARRRHRRCSRTATRSASPSRRSCWSGCSASSSTTSAAEARMTTRRRRRSDDAGDETWDRADGACWPCWGPASPAPRTTATVRLPGARAVGAAVHDGDTPQAAADYDPWQKCNRRIFAFNDTVDRWVLAPVATAWDKVTPQLRAERPLELLRQPALPGRPGEQPAAAEGGGERQPSSAVSR